MIDYRLSPPIALLTALALAGCAAATPQLESTPEHITDPTMPSAPEDPGTTFAPELGVDLSRMQVTESGLRYQALQPGTGEAAEPGDAVAVQYTGWLTSGQKFDSSLDRGEPIRFQLGAGRVIPGWDEGLQGMRVGGKRRLVIPAELGYGSRGAGGVIPPDATLLFDVELVDVR